MKAFLTTLVAEAVERVASGIVASADMPQVEVSQPKDLSRGDYMTAVALGLSKKMGQSPMMVAEALVAAIVAATAEDARIASVSIAAPGFINIMLADAFFADTVREILSAHAKSDTWGNSNAYAGKRILVEHSSPNMFKAFHVGHVMNNAIGESLVRLARASGADVTTMSYPSDVSLGIGKAVWILQQDGGLEKLAAFAQGSIEEIEYLGQCYVRGTKAYEDQPEIQSAVRAIAVGIFNKTESPEYALYLAARARNVAYFEAITKTLGSTFDAFIFESESAPVGKALVEQHIGDVFERSDNAIVYHGEQDGLHTRVFINHEGNPTYEAKDLGLLSLKFGRYGSDAPLDLSIFVTDHEQQEYFKVVAAAAGKINPVWKERTVHRLHGRMAFAGKKMSSRLGGVPSAQALLDSVYETIDEKAPALAVPGMEQSRQAIAVAALKFSILRVMAGKSMNFDPETSLSFEGDTGPYVQYSIVRALSVLKKAEAVGVAIAAAQLSTFCTAPSNWHATTLEKVLIHFPEAVAQAVADWSPHHVAGYLLELTQAFSSWYGNTKIIDSAIDPEALREDPETLYKLALTAAFATVAAKGLDLLGIRVPEKM